MKEIIAWDRYGNSLTTLVQYDQDVMVYLSEEEIDSNYNVHFFNRTMDKALVVSSEYSGGILKAKIPDVLLTEHYPIIGYVLIKKEESKSIYGFNILVREKPIPSTYVERDSKDYWDIVEILSALREYADSASQSAEKAKKSEDNAAESANHAKISETNAKASENNAKVSEANAKESEENAKTSEINAGHYAEAAIESATNAAQSEANALDSALEAKDSADKAKESESKAEDYSLLSKSYAMGGTDIRPGEDEDNSKWYYEQNKELASSVSSSAELASQSAQEAKESQEKAKESEENALVSEQSAKESADKAEKIADEIEGMAKWTNAITDDVTRELYYVGIENGIPYFCEFDEDGD